MTRWIQKIIALCQQHVRFPKLLKKNFMLIITEHLNKRLTMTLFQFGFRKKFPTQDALIYVTKTIQKEIYSIKKC